MLLTQVCHEYKYLCQAVSPCTIFPNSLCVLQKAFWVYQKCTTCSDVCRFVPLCATLKVVHKARHLPGRHTKASSASKYYNIPIKHHAHTQQKSNLIVQQKIIPLLLQHTP